MTHALAAPRPPSFSLSRTGSRAARTAAFALETWSRLALDGARMAADERARELSWVAENACALHGVRARVRGIAPTSAAVLVANHISYFDPLIIASAVPCTAIAKREVASWPLVGELCRRMGVLFVQREDPASGARTLREAMRALSMGISVLVFPEGTTTEGDEVRPFRRGIFGAAALAGVPIVPIALRYRSRHAPWVGDETFLPHYLRTIVQPCTEASVQFLAPLPLAGRSASELAESARTAIVSALSLDLHPMPRVRTAVDGEKLAVA